MLALEKTYELYKPITKVRPGCLALDSKEFIKQIYKEQYNADITVAYPYIASIYDVDKDVCTAGFRTAKYEPLFLEQYLDNSIENIAQTSRDKIAEIGNLAVTDYSKLFSLLYDISNYLILNHDVEVVCISATERLAKILNKRNIKGKAIANADQNKLKPNSNNNWGSYYATKPKVYMFNLKDNMATLEQLSLFFNKG